jgi:hypothetical protein
MDRISGANFLLVDGKRMWQDRNLATNQEGTFGNAVFFNGVQEENIAVIAAAGLEPNANDNTQMITAIRALIAAAGAGVSTATISSSGWYFMIPVAGGNPLIVMGCQVTLAAGQANVQALLPTTLPNGFIGGFVTDGGAGAYSYGVSVGADNSHVEVYCQTVQAFSGSFSPRESATAHVIVVGN